MTVQTQDGTLAESPDTDEAFIPHIIYMLSFVMNVQGQYTGGAAITAEQREPLREALKLPTAIAERMAQQLDDPSLKLHYEGMAKKFATGSGYGVVGCPRTLNPFIALANKWYAGTPK